MNDRIYELCQAIISPTYVAQGRDSIKTFENKVTQLLEQRKWQDDGWPEQWIEMFLADLAIMDDNYNETDMKQSVLSSAVYRRHFGFCQSISNPDSLTEVQPTAEGTSILMKITNSLVLDAIRQLGLTSVADAFIIPLATGMTLMYCMLLFMRKRGGKYVLWSRIDQKSCIKSVLAAGLELVVLETTLEGDEIRTDVDNISKTIERLGAENIVCFMSTTSCFAPRAPDSLEEIGMICKQYDIPHLVNNAYGLQSSKCIHLIQQAHKKGRVDVVVQSTDKNFLVPVGGSVIATFDKQISDELSDQYPGEASSSSHLDVLITLLEVGAKGYKKFLQTRKENFDYLKEMMEQCASKFGERVLQSPNNKISIGMSLEKFPQEKVTSIGSMLFTKMVSGVRVIPKNVEYNIEENKFVGFGSSHSNYPCSYLTAAASIGITKEDIDSFSKRLTKVLTKAKSKMSCSDVTSDVTGDL